MSALGLVVDPPSSGYGSGDDERLGHLLRAAHAAAGKHAVRGDHHLGASADRPRPAATSEPNTLAQGVYVGAADPSGDRVVRRTDEDFADRRGRLPAFQRRVDGYGRGRGQPELDDRTLEGHRLPAVVGSADDPHQLERDCGRHAGRGRAGAYNSYFVTLAQTLVAGGQANAYLRIGWEFDGSWTAWNATTASAEASYAAYFQQIVTAMRSVSGEHFQFVWNPDATAFTEPGYSVEAAYPGNAYVDVIGLDAYDQSWATPQTPANAWSSTLLPALTARRQFASSEGKPLAFDGMGCDHPERRPRAR